MDNSTQKKKLNLSIKADGSVVVHTPLAMTDYEAAIYLTQKGFPVTRGTLSVWRHQAKGPKFKRIGRRVRYQRDWLDRFLDGAPVQVVDPALQRLKPKTKRA